VPLKPASPATAPAPIAAQANEPAVIATPASTTNSETPPRGFLAKLRYWFGGPPVSSEPPATRKLDGPDAVDPPRPTGPAPAATEPSQKPTVAPVEKAATIQPTTATPPIEPVAVDEPLTPNQAAPAETGAPAVSLTPPAPAAPPAATPPPTPEAVDDGTIVGILTSVLDELGSAHHRPFSRG
jgi:hypothetical protein